MKLHLLNFLGLLNEDKTDILSRIGATTFSNGTTSWKVMRNIQIISGELLTLNSAVQKMNEAFEKKKAVAGGTPDENTKGEYTRQMSKLLNQVIDVDIQEIPASELSGFSPIELIPIAWMLSEAKDD